jgi:hypothetical protein
MGAPPILVREQQCADKVQSRACEFSFSHLVGEVFAKLPTPPFTTEEKKAVAGNVHAHVGSRP